MNNTQGISAAIDSGPSAGRHLRTAALVLLVSCLAARCFIAELPFRVSNVTISASQQDGRAEIGSRPSDLGEITRSVIAALLLAACVLWMIGQATSGAITIQRPWLMGAVAVLAVLTAASAAGASDRREAWTVWLDQATLLGSCVLAVQLIRSPQAMRILLVVLAAAGIALAAKGLWQVLVDFPDNAEHMKMYGTEALRQAGQDPNSPEAEMFRKRFIANTPYGYMNLSNPFGSLMIVLGFAAAGLGVWKFSYALIAAADRRKAKGQQPAGEIHMPTLAAILTLTATVGVLAVLILTKSRGAIAAGVLAAVIAVATMLASKRLATHWRKWTTAAAACALLACATVVYMGLTRDSLGSRTMTFRWYYWTGSAKIVREHPWLGTGGGNFPDAYLQHRRVEAEEAIKMPHNVFVHAAVQYGLGGGILYSGILVWVLAGLTRPSRKERPAEDEKPAKPKTLGNEKHRRAAIAAVALSTAAVGMARWFALGPDRNSAMILLDVLCPTGVFLVAAVLAIWQGSKLSLSADGYAKARLILACGVAGFALHNMVTFSIWLSGAGLVFWVCAGACLASSDAGRSLRLTKLRWPAVGLGGAALLAVIVFICSPVVARWTLTQRMAAELDKGNITVATGLAREAALADPLDAHAAADLARLLAYQQRTQDAVRWAEEAIDRNPASSSHYRLAASIINGSQTQPDRAVQYMASAVERNPMAARLRIDYARILLDSGKSQQCLQQIDRAVYIDEHLPHSGRPGGSAMRLSKDELARLDALRRRASAIANP